MANVKISEELCKACSLCIEVCPKKIISLSDSLNKNGYRTVEIEEMDKCTGCAFCAAICPDCVFEVER